MNRIMQARCVWLAGTALSMCAATPTFAQSGSTATGDQSSGNDIIVTAQRIEQRLQDVPISITVINNQQLANNNITNAKDLATYTPGLQVNSRYGADSTNFSIRGFTQEQRTSATVGTYFADVVAPRGSGGTFGGDGAGPGALFDLQNIQVLYGPQGTLQGRNVTGGSVLLVPRKPTGRLEGYVEGSAGDYAMKRIQAVLNIPVADTFRARFGLDRMVRDGYLHNIGTLGDGIRPGKGMGDVNYWAARASVVADLTPNLENYTIATYAHSKNNGTIPKLASCNASVTGQNFGVLTQARCEAQLAREAAYGPWTVENRLPDSSAVLTQWQLINTTTWTASDTLTFKNIVAYAEFRQRTNLDLFGNYYLASAAVAPSSVTSPAQVTGFAFTHANPYNNYTNAQESFVEEFRASGSAAGGRLTYQGGVYIEINDPIGPSGVQTATGTACANINTLNCVTQPGFSLGSVNPQLSKTRFTDYAGYGQASFDVTEQLKLTGGFRYTWDKQVSIVQIERVAAATPSLASCANFNAPDYRPTATNAATPFPASQLYSACKQRLSQSSRAPTWTVGVDYKPINNILVYAKYSRGYRAGGLSLFGPDSVTPTPPNQTPNPVLQPYRPEKVDTYEIGTKTSWRGAVPGSFNISGFYNEFTDQQLLLGAIVGATPTALVANAGKSRLFGLETTANVRPFRGLNLTVSYSYINTKLKSFTPLDLGTGVTLTPPVVGVAIPNTQPHKVNVSGEYTLPFVPQSVGKISIGGTYVYTASYFGVAASCPAAQSVSNGLTINTGCYDSSNNQALLANGAANPGAGINNVNPNGGRIPAAHVVSANVNWENVGGLPVDLAFFMTNVTNAVTFVSVNDNTSRSFRSRLLGEPRMFGFRAKYRFGG